MVSIPDPAWKVDPDLTADANFDERYADDGYTIFDEEPEEEEEEPVEDTALIAITRLPEIKENLRALRESWEAKAAEAARMVCTADSIQSIKKMRADMRKEFDEVDIQRKAVKERYMAAWLEVDAAWKECVAQPFGEADNTYRVLINEFEASLKEACKAKLAEYFEELCAVRSVDFLTLDQAMGFGGIRISMADANAKTPKRLMEAIADVVNKVADGMDQIASFEDSDETAEIMAEYKTRLDVGAAIATVKARRLRIKSERESAEARRIEQERSREREARVQALAPPETTQASVAPPEKTYDRITFTILNVTRSQAIKVREFLKQEGIAYE